MLKRITNCLAVLAVLCMAAPVFAKTYSQTIQITHPSTIGRQSLRPGRYRVLANLSSDRVKVEHNGKIVASVEGKTVTLHHKSPYAAVVFNHRRIHEIQFSGKMQAIELPNS